MRARYVWIVFVLVILTWPLIALGDTIQQPHLGYGFMLAAPNYNLAKVKDAGFDWFKYFVYWNDIDPERDAVYEWESVDWRLDEACDHQLNLILRVERQSDDWDPIRDDEMDDWQALFQALAEHIDQKRAACGDEYRVALEVWNEPNLDFQWGTPPETLDPVRYTEMVTRAYTGAKAGDPETLVVAGNLAPTGGSADGKSMNDVVFLEAMYAAGLKGYFDAISIHNYGYGGPPEDKDYGYGILNFRRAEDIYAVMVANGDGNKPVWATEYGWLLDSAEEGVDCTSEWDAWGFDWQKVSAEEQADYLVRSFAYAEQNWPWMQVMIVSNLDFHTTPWYHQCDPLRYFSVLQADGTARQSYTALQAMPKNPRGWGMWGMAVEPSVISTSMRLRERHLVTETVTVLNTGEYSFTWTAEADPFGAPLTITPTQGISDEVFQVVIDARSLSTGTHTSVITVTADTSEIEPITIPVTVDIWAVWGMAVNPTTLSWRQAVSETYLVMQDVAVENTGDYEFEWTVTADSAFFNLTVVPTNSWSWQDKETWTLIGPDCFRVLVDPTGLSVGLYTGTITVIATTPQVPESPLTLPVRMQIVPELYTVFLPIITRAWLPVP